MAPYLIWTEKRTPACSKSPAFAESHRTCDSLESTAARAVRLSEVLGTERERGHGDHEDDLRA
jgi:hypothetical protein